MSTSPPPPLTITPATTSDEVVDWLNAAGDHTIYARSTMSEMLGYPADAALPVDIERTENVASLLTCMLGSSDPATTHALTHTLGRAVIIYWHPTGYTALIDEEGFVSPHVAELTTTPHAKD